MLLSFLPQNKKLYIYNKRKRLGVLEDIQVLSFSEKGVVVSAQDPETSTSGKEHADCSYKGEALTVSYNAKYLIEVLQHIDTSAAIIYLSTPLSAAIVGPTKQKDNEKITTLLMPLRLNN